MSSTGEAEIRSRAEDVFTGAKIVCMTTWPYLNEALMRLVPRWNDEVPTLGVDRFYRLYMNPQYVANLKVSTLALILAGHELQHVLGCHNDRLIPERDMYVDLPSGPINLSNFCHDLAINSGLSEYANSGSIYRSSCGCRDLDFVLPRDAVYPEKFNDDKGRPLPRGLISEDYAELIKSNSKTSQKIYSKSKNGQGSGEGKEGGSGQGSGKKPHTCGSGGGSEIQPWEDPSEPVPGEPETGVNAVDAGVIAKAVAQAAEDQEKLSRGTVPGHMKLWATATLKPSKIPWQRLLRSMVRKELDWVMGQTEHTWKKLSKRSEENLLLPGTLDPQPDVVVGIDTSGSMGPKDYDASFREIHAVFKGMGKKKVPVFTVDANVYEVQMVNDVRSIKMIGGGGTDMKLAVNKAAEMKKKLVIICTDGITPWPASKPRGTKVIIALTRPVTKEYPTPAWAKVVECFDA